MNKNKILVFIGGAYVSGLEVVTLHLIGELKREGHSVRCIVNGWNDGMIIKELQKMEVPFDEDTLGSIPQSPENGRERSIGRRWGICDRIELYHDERK